MRSSMAEGGRAQRQGHSKDALYQRGAHAPGRRAESQPIPRLKGNHPALPKSLFIRADCSLHVSVSIKRSVAASIAGIALQSSIENV